MASTDHIEFLMLGPLQIRLNGQAVDPGPRRSRLILGLLLLHPGRTVHIDRLIELAWYGAAQSRTARNAVQICVSRLRAMLGEHASISTIGDGYRLDVEPGKVDLHLFRTLTSDARKQSGRARLQTLLAAERLWRGQVMSGTFSAELHEVLLAGIEEEKMAAVEARLDTQLQLGMHTTVLGELTELTQASPAREHLAELYLLALYRAGRKTDALAAYRRMRQMLVHEFGLDPTPRLAALHQAMLTDDPSLDMPCDDGEAPLNPVALLPWDIPDFTGRTAQLRWLDDLAAVQGAARTVLISAVSGIGGVGKTALAVRWAHSASGLFPDCQIYLNLHGYDRRHATPPLEALGQILRALGVPPERVPSDVDEASGLYRSMLAGRKAIVLLDNAGTVEQVRPLLPNGKDNFVLITSRDRLTGLLAHDGAKRLFLDALEPEESSRLLESIIGADRIWAQPQAATMLAQATGHLPLALRIAAATLADRPQQTIESYVDGLMGQGRLSMLAMDGDPESSVRAVFECSYQALQPGHQRMFRLLGMVPGPDVTADAAASLTRLSPADSSVLLAQLAQVHLVTEHSPGRYVMHDLIKEYALELALAVDAPAAQDSLQQLQSHYLIRTDVAARTAYPHMLRLPTEHGTGEVMSSQSDALAWFDAELPNLLAALQRAAEDGHRNVAALLADGMRGYLSIRRRFPQWLSVAQTALTCAESNDDGAARIMARLSLSQARWWLGQRAEAVEILEPAVEIARTISWHDASAALLGNLGAIYGDWGKPHDAAVYLRSAIEIYGKHGTPALSAANNLTNLAAVCNDTGRLAESAAHHVKALTLYREIGALLSAAVAESNLGATVLEQGEIAKAISHLHSALATFQESGELGGEAATLVELARAHYEQGDHDTALTFAKRGVTQALELKADRRIALGISVMGLIERDPGRHEEALLYTTDAHYVQCQVRVAQGRTLLHLGRYAEALAAETKALELARQWSFRSLEGASLSWLAEIHAACGNTDQARVCGTEAIAIHRDTGVDGLLAHTTALVGKLVEVAHCSRGAF